MHPRPTALQRATPLARLPGLLAELGVPLEPVFAGTGVGPEDLRPDAFIPYAAAPVLLERAAELSGCEDLGLRLGRGITIASLGPVGQVMIHAATLGEALSDFVAGQITNSTASAVYLNRTEDDFVLGYGIYEPDLAISPQLHDVALAAGCNLIRDLTHGAVRPAELVMMRPRPSTTAPWAALADCPIRFGQPETCLVLPRAALDFCLPDADRSAHAVRLAELVRQIAVAPWGTTGQVMHALRALVISGKSRMPDMAAHLDTTPRTLRRALAREGTTFEAVRDAVRFAMARELLALTPLPVGDIALTLGFASPSSFVHAFRRWDGCAPTAWRAIRRTPAAPHRAPGQNAAAG